MRYLLLALLIVPHVSYAESRYLKKATVSKPEKKVVKRLKKKADVHLLGFVGKYQIVMVNGVYRVQRREK